MAQKKKLNLEDVLRKEPLSYNQIKQKTGLTKKAFKQKLSELKEQGVPISYYVDENNYTTYFYIDKNPQPIQQVYDLGLRDGNYKFLAISDTHMGDKQFRLDALNSAFDRAEDEGVQYITHTGDLTAGIQVYSGQHSDLKYHTLDDQIDFVVDNFPSIEGVQTKIIGGNHDYDGLKRMGIDIMRIIDSKRPDIDFLGWTDAKLDIGNGVIAELVHYKGSMAWSLGYRAQKFLRDLNPNQMPDILLLGHKHVTMYAYIQGVHSFECGTFQGETNFTKERGLHSKIACWIIEYDIENGKLNKIKPELLLF